jgi:hypothetical protein
MDISTAYEHARENVLFLAFRGAVDSGGASGVSSHAIAAAYQNGFHGCFLDVPEAPRWARTIASHERDQLLGNATCETRLEYAIPTEYQLAGRGKRAIHWNHYRTLDPAKALRGSQDHGNCTAWALREIVGCEWGTDISHRREPQGYTSRPGTAVTYGSRGHRGQGSALSTLVKVVYNRGIQCETTYCDGRYDLRNERDDESYGNQWGGTGPPSCILDEIANDKIEQFAYATEEDAIIDVLHLGHFLFHGSTLTARTTGTLISPLTSIGGHAQAVIGYDDTDETREWIKQNTGTDLRNDWIAINDQSWGRWNTFPDSQWPAHLWGDRPEGVWCIRGSDLMRIVRQWGDCIAISNVLGFPKRDLDWSMF